MKTSYTLILALLLATGAQAEQICRPGAVPVSRWKVRADGSVIDFQGRLQWQRCPQGLHGKNCAAGELQRFNAVQARELVRQINRNGLAGQHDWRLPTVAELKSLVSAHCLNPAIDIRLFPNTPQVEFWSGESDGAQSGYVDFRDGYASRDDDNLPNAVRLVRNIR